MDELLTIVFWNLRGNDLAPYVARLAHEQQADVVVLAECAEPDEAVRRALHDTTGRPFDHDPDDLSRLRVFWSGCQTTTVRDGDRYTGRRLVLPEGHELGLFAVHLPSQLHRGPRDIEMAARLAVRELEAFEQRLGHARSVVVGDFNMDPFEPGMVGVDGFHAVADKNIALRRERTVQGGAFRFLYNPMWSRMGDCSPGPPGSYFYDRGGAHALFWHLFDQVLVRPDLVDALVVERVGIVDQLAEDSLLAHGRPDSSRFSDHLPLRFSLARSRIPV